MDVAFQPEYDAPVFTLALLGVGQVRVQRPRHTVAHYLEAAFRQAVTLTQVLEDIGGSLVAKDEVVFKEFSGALERLVVGVPPDSNTHLTLPPLYSE